MEKDGLRFEAPAYTGEVERYSFDAEGTTVVAFFPGAFTEVCTEEMCMLRDSMQELDSLGADVLGISVDTPFALREFARQNDLSFPLISDHSAEISKQYGVDTEMPGLGYRVATRAVFLIEDGEVLYREVLDDPTKLPDLGTLKKHLKDS